MVMTSEEPLQLLDPQNSHPPDLNSHQEERETAIVDDIMEAAWEGIYRKSSNIESWE